MLLLIKNGGIGNEEKMSHRLRRDHLRREHSQSTLERGGSAEGRDGVGHFFFAVGNRFPTEMWQE